MIDFWTKGIGAHFKEYRSFGGAEGAVLKLDTLQVNLRVPKESEAAEREKSSCLGYDHLGFEVDDLDRSCKQLMDYGCTINSGPTELQDRKIVFLSGPETITLELMQMY